jgi:hypothetical protein
MTRLSRMLQICRSSMIASYRTVARAIEIERMSNRLRISKRLYFAIPEPYIRLVSAVGEPASLQFTIVQSLELITFIEEACEMNECRRAKFGDVDLTIDARATDGSAEYIDIKISKEDTSVYQQVRRDDLLNAVDELSSRIGFTPHEVTERVTNRFNIKTFGIVTGSNRISIVALRPRTCSIAS